MKGFVKRYPMLFVGGKGSLPTCISTSISRISFILSSLAAKGYLLFPFEEQHKLYRKPWEVLSFVNFEKYFDEDRNKLDLEKYPGPQAGQGL